MTLTTNSPTHDDDDANSPTVLIAGATGWLGAKIAREVAASGSRARIGLRGGTTHPEAANLSTVLGADIVELDLTKPETLPGAVDGVDVVISVIQGGPELLIDGQAALARAAYGAGVRRIFPSDFGVDFTQIPDMDHLFFAWRSQGQEAIAATGLAQTNTYNGAFAEMLLPNPFLPLIDWEKAVVPFWGSPEQIYDFTATDDVARYVAAAANDLDLGDRPLRVAGFSHSAETLAEIATDVTGKDFTVHQLGTTEELIDTINARQSEAPDDPTRWVGLQYVRSMTTGAGRLHDLDNDRYPHINPIGAQEFLTQHQP